MHALHNTLSGTRTTFHHLRVLLFSIHRDKRRRQELDSRLNLLTEVERTGCRRWTSLCLLSLLTINTIIPPCFQSQIPNCQTISHHAWTSFFAFSLTLSLFLSPVVTKNSHDNRAARPNPGTMCVGHHGHVDASNENKEEDSCHHVTVCSFTSHYF